MSNIRYEKGSIKSRIYRLCLYIFLPMLLMALFIFSMLIACNYKYSSVSKNITNASRFSQNFKDDVDLKMYYFVIGNSSELPYAEVQTARELAETLRANSTNSESLKAINNIINLCDSLDSCIERIEKTDGYDQRIEQLDNNIYVITELIQEHLYSYLYCEAGVMARIEKELNLLIIAEIIASVLVMAVVVSFTLSSAFKISKSINDPIEALSRRVDEIGQGDLTEKTPVSADDARLSSLSTGIEQMAGRLNQQIELNRQEQIRLRGIELSLIQAQINPHFLYNTLDAIVWLIETEKNQAAEEMVTSLSTYFRSFLSNGKTIITIAEEEQHVRSYLQIQQVRYSDILDYEINVDDAIGQCLIPKMTLQPLVENAIYHGIKPKRGRSSIQVTGTIDDGKVTLCVRDNGVGMDAETLEKLRSKIINDDHSSFGLAAAYKRLGLVYGADCGFTIESQPNVGTEITIRIPYKTERDGIDEETI